jgi:hypothetical protein
MGKNLGDFLQLSKSESTSKEDLAQPLCPQRLRLTLETRRVAPSLVKIFSHQQYSDALPSDTNCTKCNLSIDNQSKTLHVIQDRRPSACLFEASSNEGLQLLEANRSEQPLREPIRVSPTFRNAQHQLSLECHVKDGRTVSHQLTPNEHWQKAETNLAKQRSRPTHKKSKQKVGNIERLNTTFYTHPPIVQDVHDQVQKMYVKENKTKAAPASEARSTYRLRLFMECFEPALKRLRVVVLSLNQRLPSDLKRQGDTRIFRV